MTENLLTIRDLTVDAPAGDLEATAQRGQPTVAAGEAVALVGESGSGKSLTTRSVMRLLPADFAVTGAIEYDGEDVLTMNSARCGASAATRSA